MGESNLGVELISKDGVINALIPIMCEFSIDPYIQGRIIGCILNCKIAYDLEKVVAELEEKAQYYRDRRMHNETIGNMDYAIALGHKEDAVRKSIIIVKRGGAE